MRITDVRAHVLKFAKPRQTYSGGAGVSGRIEHGVDSAYQIIHPYPTAYSRNIEALIIEVDTDAGVTGVGEGQFPVVPEAGAVVVESLFRPLLLGKDPLAIDELYDLLYGLMNCRGHGGGLIHDAIAAVDNALWDIAGKAEGTPVCRLLAGNAPARVPLYVSGLPGETIDARIEFARNYVDRGFSAFKVFLGKGVREDIHEVTSLRDALGSAVELMVDVQWMYQPRDAIALGKELQRLDVKFLETPCAPEDLDGCAAVAAELELPVALGECERTRFQVREVLRRAAADVVQPDIGRTGISEGRAIIELVRSHGRQITLHMGVGLFGYIAASVQVAASDAGPILVEYQPEMLELASSLIEQPFLVEDGAIVVTERPGLGFDVDFARLREYEVVPPGGHWSSDRW